MKLGLEPQKAANIIPILGYEVLFNMFQPWVFAGTLLCIFQGCDEDNHMPFLLSLTATMTLLICGDLILNDEGIRG